MNPRNNRLHMPMKFPFGSHPLLRLPLLRRFDIHRQRNKKFPLLNAFMALDLDIKRSTVVSIIF